MAHAYDHYSASHELATCLLAEGQVEWHDKLEDAIAEGTTATEILMALRFVLRSLKSRSLALTECTNDRMNTLLTEVDRSLA